MILYVTDDDGEQYQAHIESAENKVVDYSFGSPRVELVTTTIEHTVTVTKFIDEFVFQSGPTDDPATTINAIFSEIQRRVK